MTLNLGTDFYSNDCTSTLIASQPSPYLHPRYNLNSLQTQFLPNPNFTLTLPYVSIVFDCSSKNGDYFPKMIIFNGKWLIYTQISYLKYVYQKKTSTDQKRSWRRFKIVNKLLKNGHVIKLHAMKIVTIPLSGCIFVVVSSPRKNNG